jgi:hypothetical protein
MAMSSADRKRLQRERLKNGEKWFPVRLSATERKSKSRSKVAAASGDVTNVTHAICASVDANGKHCKMLFNREPVLYNGFTICPNCAWSINIGYSHLLVQNKTMLRTAGSRLSQS